MDTATELRIACLVFSRIVGYLTPVDQWHAGKKQEFQDRKMFVLPVAAEEKEDA